MKLQKIHRLLNQGLIKLQSGDFNAAKRKFEEALEIHPENFDALHMLGIIAFQLNTPADGVKLILRAIKINPKNAAAHNNCALGLQKLSRIEDALYHFDKALEIHPTYGEAHANRGLALLQVMRFEEALKSLNDAITLIPNYAEAYSNRGLVLHQLSRFDEAVNNFDSALSINPHYAEAHSNRGLSLMKLGRFDEALQSFDLAILINPEYAGAHSNRGLALKEFLRLEDAIESFDQAINIQSDFIEAHWNKSLCLLLDGDMRNGLKLYESRLILHKKNGLHREFNAPRWTGNESLRGKTIFIYSEQGLGDVIQFCRYVEALTALGAKVLLEVSKSLTALLQNLKGAPQLIENNHPNNNFDYFCPLLSLPLAFQTTLHSIPNATQYLASTPEKKQKWSKILGERKNLRIGIAWSGNADHINDKNRSLNLREFIQYLPARHEFISLQKEIRKTDREHLHHTSVRHFEDHIEDFSDTAALIELVDLVISVDTSVVHLAGALGKETWLLLPFLPDWRWLLGRDTTPWYPSMKIYRQSEDRHWPSVLKTIATKLEGF